jgi:indole-3-glycerol phosphate synthase
MSFFRVSIMNVLDEICARKRQHIAAQKQKISLDALKKKALAAVSPRGFIKALKAHTAPSIIAEIKKASPSRGIIRADFDPAAIAQIYEQNGAACISVLTDEPYFQGRDDYLESVTQAVSLPLLRKDFMLEEYQLYESRALGADCILLIMAALSDDEAESLYKLSEELGMDVLVEVHDEEELIRALKLDPPMIGINNRSLKTLKVDIQTSFSLGQKIPGSVLRIAESGLSEPGTIKELQGEGFGGFLIGESLMKQKDIGAALRTLTENY